MKQYTLNEVKDILNSNNKNEVKEMIDSFNEVIKEGYEKENLNPYNYKKFEEIFKYKYTALQVILKEFGYELRGSKTIKTICYVDKEDKVLKNDFTNEEVEFLKNLYVKSLNKETLYIRPQGYSQNTKRSTFFINPEINKKLEQVFKDYASFSKVDIINALLDKALKDM